MKEGIGPIQLGKAREGLATPPGLDSELIDVPSSPDSGKDLATLMAPNDQGATTTKGSVHMPSGRGESNSALAHHTKPYEIVDLKINPEQ